MRPTAPAPIDEPNTLPSDARRNRSVESGAKGQLFLQQAETVRFVSPTTSTAGKVEDWQPLSVTDVEGGEALLIREITRGTHMGKAIDASVTES